MNAAVNLFDLPGRWYRGNTHTHSTVSDGSESIEARFQRYRAAGYDFLVMTDHGAVSDVSRFSRDGFLAISGSELHPANPFGGTMYHVVAINIDQPIDVADVHPQQVLDAVAEQGGASIIAHPYWSAFVLSDFCDLTGYCAIEVYNQTCYLQNGKGHSENTWDDHLDRIGCVWGTAADDAHDLDADVLKAWINIRAPELTPEAVVHALRTGAFYSTQGPEFHDIQIENADPNFVIIVKSSPVRSIVFKANFRWGANVLGDDGQLLESARYECNGNEKYVRIELTDHAGRKAWSNPFFLNHPQPTT